MKIGIITGASSGLGAEFAHQLDDREECEELWLIARRRDRLNDVAKEIRHCHARVIPMDLMKPGELAALGRMLGEEKAKVRWLINNAGFGKIGPFREKSSSVNLGMIDLNIRALTELTQMALPFCEKGSRIVQVASSAGFQPVPQMALYAATKAFVVHFSDALHSELKDSGISVTAVCPGPVDTEFFQIALDSEMPARFAMEKPSTVVRQALRDAERGKMHSFPSTVVTAMAYSGRIVSWTLLLKVLSRMMAPKKLDKWFGLENSPSQGKGAESRTP